MSLKRRFVGLAAIAGVIFLINFPSPTAVAAVVAVLIAGVILTNSASTSLDTGGDVKARLDEFRRQKLQKALDISRANAAAHRKASVDAPTAPASENAPLISIAQAERQAALERDSPSLNHKVDSSRGIEEGAMGNNTTASKSETSVGVQQKLEQPIQQTTLLLEQQEDKRQVSAPKPSPGSTRPSSDHSTANGHSVREQLPPINASGPNKPALAGGAAVLARLRYCTLLISIILSSSRFLGCKHKRFHLLLSISYVQIPPSKQSSLLSLSILQGFPPNHTWILVRNNLSGMFVSS